MKKIIKKILFILLFLHTVVPSVIRANFPLSFETSVVCFSSGFLATSFCECVKKIFSNPGPYINFVRKGVRLTCDCINFILAMLENVTVPLIS